jgi:serine/threonine protein kinase
MLFKGQTLGKYRILSPLGSGGFGTVYLARDTWLDKQVAIKVPHRQNLDFSELLREPRLLASVNHPNIVAITTADKQDDVFFIVMEYVAGETLESVLERDGALDLPRALDYTVQIGNAVDHAHKQGVIHRDLRPANVLVSENGMLKVADFGTSRFLEIAAHGTTVIGSPAFMAPEQFQGKAVFASDLYSVGITMYQMLTGELPYEPPPPSDLHKLLTGELVTPPRSRNPAIPRRLNDIVMKALAPQITDRYTRASDLLDDLLAAKSVILGTPGPRAIVDMGLDDGNRPARGSSPPLPRAVKYQDREAARNCWHCRRPLHNLASKCPFCGENQ